MTFDLTSNGVVWSLDAQWSLTTRRPSSHALRAKARADGASHYAVSGRGPYQTGFFNFGAKVERKAVQPLALAVAVQLGPQAILEMEVEPGRFWIVGTTGDGQLAPYADAILRGDDLEAFKDRLPIGEDHIRRVTLDDVDEFIAALKPVTLALHTTSTVRQRKRAALIAIALGVAGGTAWFWHAHELELAREKAIKVAQEAARRRRLAALIPTTAPPDAWLSACLSHIDRTPVFNGGWILKSWTCRNSGLLLTWERAGGTMADAPIGEIGNNPDLIEQTVPLTFSMKRTARPASEDGTRAIIAILQTLGVRPAIAHSVIQPGPNGIHGAMAGKTATILHFDWPTDPRDQQWDTIAGLTFSELKHDTGASSGGASTTPPYQFTASVATRLGQ